VESWLERTSLLLGDEKLERLRNKSVLVVGVGGVGAYAAEMICRAGVGRMMIIDGDVVNESNINRQLVALHGTVGERKVDVLAKRLMDINPDSSLLQDTSSYRMKSPTSCWMRTALTLLSMPLTHSARRCILSRALREER
jgi:Dinucleotide-utilizing enzymes involved in molybdopterin and thiamine biosynthesis family 1